MATYYIKQGDRSPILQATLTDPSGVAEDLTSATSLKVRIKKPGASSYLVEANATISDAANGVVQYQFDATGTDVPGYYLLEWVLDEGLVTEQTFPNYRQDGVYIERKI